VPSAAVSPVHLSNTWPAAGGKAKTSTREPAGYVPPPEPPAIVTAVLAPAPVTTTNECTVTVTRRCSVTSQLTSRSPGEPGLNENEFVPWPPVGAAPAPATVQRNVRSPLFAGGNVAVADAAVVATEASTVIVPAVAAEITTTSEVTVVVAPLTVTVTDSVMVPAVPAPNVMTARVGSERIFPPVIVHW